MAGLLPQLKQMQEQLADLHAAREGILADLVAMQVRALGLAVRRAPAAGAMRRVRWAGWVAVLAVGVTTLAEVLQSRGKNTFLLRLG